MKRVWRATVQVARSVVAVLRPSTAMDPIERAHGENLSKVPFNSGGGPMGGPI